MRYLKTYENYIGSPLLKLTDNVDHHLMDIIESEVPKGSSILEISCGNAADSKYLLESGYKVICTETNLEYIEHAKSIGLDCINHDTKNKFPFSDNQFDLIYSRLGLHYFSSDELDNILCELSRIGKKILFTVKYEESKGLNVFGQQATGKVFINENQWKEIVSKYFTIKSFEIKEGIIYGSFSKWIEIIGE
jgi:SAM-dependent methyltransferase